MTGWVEPNDPTLIILKAIGDGAFFFLPVMVAASASIKFKTNMSLSIAIAGVLIHPNFMELMKLAAQGQHVDFFGIPITSVKYTYTVIPALVMTWVLSYIENWVDKITPDGNKKLPQANAYRLIRRTDRHCYHRSIWNLGWNCHLFTRLHHSWHTRLVISSNHGALWPLLVLTGMHRVFTPTIIQTIAETGREGW